MSIGMRSTTGSLKPPFHNEPPFATYLVGHSASILNRWQQYDEPMEIFAPGSRKLNEEGASDNFDHLFTIDWGTDL